METIRQKKVGALVMKELNTIFQKLGLHTMNGGLISITHVGMTPDLSVARVNLSVFKIANTEDVLDKMRETSGDLRRQLGNSVRHQLRIVPHLEFYIDDTLENVFRLEEIFKNIKKK